MLACLTPLKEGCGLRVQVVPRASRTEVVDLVGDRCRMRVKAPPVDGAANDALVAFLARLFGLPRTRVEIVRGAAGRHKDVRLYGMAPAAVEAILTGCLGGRTG